MGEKLANKTERIDKLLSGQGICSRRDCDRLIRSGRITLNGNVVRSGSEKCDPEKDTLCFDNKPVNYKKHVYYMMNKPSGVLSATSDKKAKTVLDLLPEEMSCRRGLFPAGRLDFDTEGLLIITDDGDFAHRLLSPSCHVPKTYHVTVDKPIPKEAVERFREGMYIDGGHFTMPAKLVILSDTEGLLTIAEGKYHQVKLMMKKVGCTVTHLRRISIGSLSLPDSLKGGEVVELDEKTAIGLLNDKLVL